MTRDEAINELKCAIDLIKQDGKDWLDKRDIPLLQMAIEALERKRGEWIQIEDVDANGNAWYECPFCHKGDCHAVSQIVSYCWNCGADMRGDTDE